MALPAIRFENLGVWKYRLVLVIELRREAECSLVPQLALIEVTDTDSTYTSRDDPSSEI